MIARSVVVQKVLDLFVKPRYLEIGVDSGDTFRSVSATIKTAVDPNFKFIPPPNSENVYYYAKTSDEYFGECEVKNKFDVVYIDGLHTFEQSFRDLVNSLSRLDPRGVIILDDVLPVSYHSSLASISQAFRVRDYLAGVDQALKSDNTWMGSVYKLVFLIEAFFQQITYATVQENHGQLIAWFQPRSEKLLSQRAIHDIAVLDFSDTIIHRSIYNIAPLDTILSEIRQVNAHR